MEHSCPFRFFVGLPTVAYLCKVAPMAKFKCVPFLIISVLDTGTIFMNDEPCIK